jgi:uncharacterized damage-inducible protein DinB
MDVFAKQYEWIKRTRETLFHYCETMSPEDYVKELDTFGGDSIRNLHAHVAGCYQIWLGSRALGKSISRIDPETVNNVQEMRELFRKTDDLVHEFLHEFQGKWEHSIPVTFQSGHTVDFTTLWLFTHTTTHEFHHKGQIVKIGRQLGHTPPDTDLIEPQLVK